MCGKRRILPLIKKTTHNHDDPFDYNNYDDICDEHERNIHDKDYVMQLCKGGHLIDMSGKCKKGKIRLDEPI